MKRIILALILSLFMSTAVATAAPVDMATMTCEDAISDADGFVSTNFWLMGYLGGKTDDTVMSFEMMETFANKIADMCMERPEATLGDVINHLLQQ